MLFGHVKQFLRSIKLAFHGFCIALPPPIPRYHVPASLSRSAFPLHRPYCWHLRDGWTVKRIKLDRPGRFCILSFRFSGSKDCISPRPTKEALYSMTDSVTTRQDMWEVSSGSLFLILVYRVLSSVYQQVFLQCVYRRSSTKILIRADGKRYPLWVDDADAKAQSTFLSPLRASDIICRYCLSNPQYLTFRYTFQCMHLA